MNRLQYIFSLFALVALSSCLKEVTLEPKPFPLLLSNEVRLVEIFDDGTMLVGGRDGYYLQYSDGSSFVHEVSSQSEFSSRGVEQMNFYRGPEGTYYGVNSTYVLTINASGYSFNDHNLILNGTLSEPGYTAMPDGRLMRADYSELTYDAFHGDYRYFIRLSIWDGSAWDTRVTDVPLTSTYYARYTPSPIFEDDNTLYISSYELYEIEYKSSNYLTYNILTPSNDPFQFGPTYHGRFVDNHIIGFDVGVQDNHDIQYSYVFSTKSGLIDIDRLAESCDYGASVFDIDQIVAADGRTTYCFDYFTYNSLSEEAIRGYLVAYDHLAEDCTVTPILAIGILANTQLDIHNVAFNTASNKAYLATNMGLIEYDLTTNETRDYLTLILEANEED